MLPRRPRLQQPGLFITATDTDVGKTVGTCALAWQLRRQGDGAVGVCKPYASGCRRDREGLVSPDAEALAHFADCRLPLDVINPIRYAAALAPAVAAELTEAPPDLQGLIESLERLDAAHDFMLLEGVGGLLTPLDPRRPATTVLDLIAALGYPVAVVCRAGLGTLNHTAMTVRLLRDAGCDVAGLIVNGYLPDPGEVLATAVRQGGAKAVKRGARTQSGAAVTQRDDKAATVPASLGADPLDVSMATNRRWLERMNRTSVLATLPVCPAASVAPQKGVIHDAILDAMGLTFWPDVLRPPRR